MDHHAPGTSPTVTFRPWRLLAAVLLAGLFGNGTCADDAAGRRAEPFVIVRLAGVDRLLEDVDQLLEAGDAVPFGTVVRGFLAGLNELRGIDRSRPLGGMLFLNSDQPETPPTTLLFVPLDNLSDLRTTLASLGQTLEETSEEEVYRWRLGRDELRLRVAGEYLCVTDERRPAPPVSAEQLAVLLKEFEGDPDFALRLRRAGMPATLVEQARQRIEQEFLRELQRSPPGDEVEQELREALLRTMADTAKTFLSDTDSVTLLCDLPAVPQPLRLELQLAATPEGGLFRGLQAALARPDRLTSVGTDQAALCWRHALVIPPALRDLSRRLLALARSRVETSYDARVPEDVRTHIGRLLDALDATLAAGRCEGMLEFLPTSSGHFVLATAIGIEHVEAVDAAARGLLPHARESPEVRSVLLDHFRIGDLAFHRIEGQEVRRRDARLYGDDVALHLAVGRGALWLVLGGGQTEAALDSLLGADASPATADAAIQLDLHLKPWVEFASRLDGNARQRLTEFARQAIADAGSDAASLRLTATPTRATLRVTLERGYLRLAARAAVEAARHRGQD
jgi:hypothetical protein